MPRGDQFSRQWKLLQILASRGGRTIPELMQEVACSRRTVWRDLGVLQAVGFPLTCNRDGRESRYRLIEGARGLPPIPFTLTELMSLHLGRHLLVPLRGTPVGEQIHTALEKIAATLAPGAKTFLEHLNQELSARTVQTKDYGGSQEVIELDRYLEGSFGLFRGRPVQVSLRFSRAVARYVAERRWHPTQVAAPLLTGELDLTLKVPISPELKSWILSYGKDVEVREPTSLRAEIRREWLAALRGAGGRVETPQAAPISETAQTRPRRPGPRPQVKR